MRWTTARIAAVAGLVAAFGTLAFLLTHDSGGYRVTAVFDQANGIVKGSDVKVAGQNVGRVESVDLGRDRYPRLRLRIDDDYPLRRGAVADLRFFSVSGEVNRYVALHQGSGPLLHDGSVLGRANTDQPVEIDQVLDTLDPRTRADVRAVISGLDEGTRGRGDQIAATLRHSARALREASGLAGEVASDGRSLRTFTVEGRRMVGALSRSRGALGSTATRLGSVLDVTAGRQAELDAALRRLPAGLASPRMALQSTDAAVPDLRRLVAAARPAARELVPTSRALRPALAAARPALDQAGGLVAEAPGRLRRLRTLLPSASRTMRTLGPVLAKGNPMLDQVRARIPDFFSFFNNWADFTSNYDANGHAARVGLVIDPAPLNVIGPSDSGAGQMKAPFMRTPGVLEGEPWNDYRRSFVGGGR